MLKKLIRVFQVLLAMVFVSHVTPVFGSIPIVGFDCDGRNKHGQVNITTWSTLEPKPCSLDIPEVKSSNVSIQLLQVLHFQDIPVFQCKIKIRRTVRRCSWFGNLEPVDNGLQEYLLDISYDNCKRIHDTNTFLYDAGHVLTNLRMNDTTSRGIYLAGDAIDNSCHTGSFSDQFGSWNKVNVEALISITLHEYSAQVDISTNKIVLRSGVICAFDTMPCIDSEGGHTFWRPIKSVDCINDKYDILYDGIVTKLEYIRNNFSEEIFMINDPVWLFSFANKGTIRDCGDDLIRTEEPRIFIRNSNNNKYRFKQNRKIGVDLLTHLGAKIIFLDRHFSNQIENLHTAILKRRCESKTAELRQLLNLAHLSPDLFAYTIMQGPGYVAHVAGEVVHVVKCAPVEVNLATDLQECYENLPVYHNEELRFLTPKTRILIKNGIQVKCNPLLPSYFKIGKQWISLGPTVRKVDEPKSLEPDIRDNFTLGRLINVATAGIYSQQDLENFIQRLLFPIEKQSLLNSVARAMVNEPVKDQAALANLITDNVITSIAMRTWNYLWADFMIFGQFSSGIISIIMISQVVIMIVEFLIRGYTLHKIFGWSGKILGAVFGSLTHLFVAAEHNSRIKQRMGADDELDEIIIDHSPHIPAKPKITYANPSFAENSVVFRCPSINLNHGRTKILKSSF